jgi:hypothetical protein
MNRNRQRPDVPWHDIRGRDVLLGSVLVGIGRWLLLRRRPRRKGDFAYWIVQRTHPQVEVGDVPPPKESDLVFVNTPEAMASFGVMIVGAMAKQGYAIAEDVRDDVVLAALDALDYIANQRGLLEKGEQDEPSK